MNKHLCSWHDSIPWIDYYLNDQILSGTSKYIYSYNFISIWFKFLWYVKYLRICVSGCIQHINMVKKNLLSIGKCCIGCMLDYTSGGYIYFKNKTYRPETHHRVCILNQVPYIYRTSPLNFQEKRLYHFQNYL